MRAINLLYLGIIAMMCVFCNDSGSHAPHRTYFLSLSFVDTEGNDLVKGLRGIEPEDSDKPDYVAPDLYTLVSSPDRFTRKSSPSSYPPPTFIKYGT